MGLEVRIDTRDLLGVSKALKRVGDKGLGKQMGRALQKASEDLRPTIRESAAALLPSRGGYAGVMSKSLKFRQQLQTSATSARVVFLIHADGRRERRDVPAVNRGRLRHPVYGNRDAWTDQKVRPGFVDRPVDKLQPQIAARMKSVVDYFADQIGA